MDGRRHSVDVPISKTLIALRRVRSLRDPSTNSTCKLSSMADDFNWETNSNNAIVLGFENDNPNNENFAGMKKNVNGPELFYTSRHCNEDSNTRITNGETECENGGKYYKDCVVKGSELTPSDFCIEGGGSCNELDEVSQKAEKKSKRRKKHERMSRVTAGDLSSPYCLSTCGTPKELSSFYGNDDDIDDDVMELTRGCGISSCWSGSQKFRESSLVEERPLLLENSREFSRDWNTESPRNLCQKFTPKSFTELVGQNIIARSLLSAISNGRIASFYLFHGPRGTGKTSASRIFAAALNCLSPKIEKPCGICQECVLFFSGRSRDVKEVDSVRINRIERCRSFVKKIEIPPVFSRFKVYIIDECHLLRGETWASILRGLEEIPRNVVFIMVTPDLEKLPRGVVSKSQRFQFQKVKEVDVCSRLRKICVEEGLEFDLDALNFIATKSNGSLRDAEMMLDQLSLLGKKITVSLVYEVNGVVSDEELLDLLHLALSSDASNTVKRARELMRSRIDPLQLTSQLANLIMDILAEKWPSGVSDVRQKLFGTDDSEAGMQQLSHALKVLSETEKQLRMSKNQSTWLTAALLQLSSVGSSSHDVVDSRPSMRSLHPQDGDFLSTSSTGESLKLPVVYACENVEYGKMRVPDSKETLEVVWRRASGMCASTSLKRFLQKKGKLVSIRLNQGIAVAELEFDRPDYVSKAEKSWKVIATALQHMLGHNVELRINLANNPSKKNRKFKKPSFNLFGCSRRLHLRSHFSAESGSNVSESSDVTPITVITSLDKYVETCSSECGSHSQVSHTCCHGKELFKTIRNIDGNALSIGINTPHGQSLPDSRQNGLGTYPSNEGVNTVCPNSNGLKIETRLKAKEFKKLRCWRTAMLPFRKVWQLKHHQHQSDRLVDCPLPCAAAAAK